VSTTTFSTFSSHDLLTADRDTKKIAIHNSEFARSVFILHGSDEDKTLMKKIIGGKAFRKLESDRSVKA
jgi:hypothetical protein